MFVLCETINKLALNGVCASPESIYGFRTEPSKLLVNKIGEKNWLEIPLNDRPVKVAINNRCESLALAFEFNKIGLIQTEILNEIQIIHLSVLNGEISEVKFAENDKYLVVGSSKGDVLMLNLDNFEAVKILQVNSPIFQISSAEKNPGLLLISSMKETLICDVGDKKSVKIGTKQRNGKFGADFCGNGIIFCARPKGNIWMSDKNGKVLQTLKFPNEKNVEFSKILSLKRDKNRLISYSANFLHLIDTNENSVVSLKIKAESEEKVEICDVFRGGNDELWVLLTDKRVLKYRLEKVQEVRVLKEKLLNFDAAENEDLKLFAQIYSKLKELKFEFGAEFDSVIQSVLIRCVANNSLDFFGEESEEQDEKLKKAILFFEKNLNMAKLFDRVPLNCYQTWLTILESDYSIGSSGKNDRYSVVKCSLSYAKTNPELCSNRLLESNDVILDRHKLREIFYLNDVVRNHPDFDILAVLNEWKAKDELVRYLKINSRNRNEISTRFIRDTRKLRNVGRVILESMPPDSDSDSGLMSKMRFCKRSKFWFGYFGQLKLLSDNRLWNELDMLIDLESAKSILELGFLDDFGRADRVFEALNKSTSKRLWDQIGVALIQKHGVEKAKKYLVGRSKVLKKGTFSMTFYRYIINRSIMNEMTANIRPIT